MAKCSFEMCGEEGKAYFLAVCYCNKHFKIIKKRLDNGD